MLINNTFVTLHKKSWQPSWGLETWAFKNTETIYFYA